MASLAYRAAEYFGVHKEPRTSVMVRRNRCLLVARRGGGTALMDYSEERREPRGAYLFLADDKRDALVAALQGGGDA